MQRNWNQDFEEICTDIFTAILSIAKIWEQPVSFNRWMIKENAVYTHNGVVFSFKKEGNPAICDNMHEPGEYCAQWNKPDTEVIYYVISLS